MYLINNPDYIEKVLVHDRVIQPYVLTDIYSWLGAHSGLSHSSVTTATPSTIEANTGSLNTSTTSSSSSNKRRFKKIFTDLDWFSSSYCDSQKTDFETTCIWNCSSIIDTAWAICRGFVVFVKVVIVTT